MKDYYKVEGLACLDYTDLPIGFLSSAPRGGFSYNDYMINGLREHNVAPTFGNSSAYQQVGQDYSTCIVSCGLQNQIIRFRNSGRVCGLILDDNDDGSYKIAIMGNESISYRTDSNIDHITYGLLVTGRGQQDPDDDEKYIIPEIPEIGTSGDCIIYIYEEHSDGTVTYNTADLLDYEPTLEPVNQLSAFGIFLLTGIYHGNNLINNSNISRFELSTDKTNTLILGAQTFQSVINLHNHDMKDIRNQLCGDFYDYGVTSYSLLRALSLIIPPVFEGANNLYAKGSAWGGSANFPIEKHAFSFIPCNMVLTRLESSAIDYVQNGNLPSDAFLYPLDWDKLPSYKLPDLNNDDDDDDGDPDGTNPDGNRDRDVDPTPLVTPTIVPTMLNANNIYWLGVGRLGMFFTWFWYDIQQFSILDPTTWDNIFDNIQGLYNNLSSAILSIRYYPVRPEWVGGLGNQSRIKLAQIEQDGAVDTINTFTQPPIEKIGSFNVAKDFDSYLDLAPYSQLVLYLPYYGYVDLDIDIFNGYSLDVYATYDILSGTITYYVYYDDTFMLNTYTAKMSVDIPITLQTQYERDRTIQSNITTALSGFMSAGAGALTGNPIGAVLGVNALQASMSPQNTAPIKVEGMLAEQGMFYAPSKCAVILRRPTTTKKGDAFKRNNGYLWCKTETLKNLSGLTICKNPRITFNGSEYYNDSGQPTGKMLLPLDSEITEIYELLEGGVII